MRVPVLLLPACTTVPTGAAAVAVDTAPPAALPVLLLPASCLEPHPTSSPMLACMSSA
jgi:hypothetical protein